MPNTPFMNMTLPAVGVTPGGYSGTSWGPLLTQSLEQVDAHDHSPGKGAPLTFTSGSFQVATDLGFGGHSLYSIQNVLASGTITAQAFSGSLTQIRSGSFSSGSWTGGVPYSGSFVPGGNFTYSTSSLAAFVGVGGIQVATNSLGQVLISASIGDDKYASYVLTVPDAENPNFRTLAVVSSGSGAYLTLTDGGPGNNLTIALKDFDPWNDTGNGLYTTSSVTVIGPGGFTGSLTRTNTGNPYLIGVGGVSITTNSLGQVLVSSSVPPPDFDPFVVAGAASIYTTSSVSIDSSGLSATQHGTDVFFFVSGTTGIPVGSPGRMVAVFGGNEVVSGSLHALAGLSVDGLGASLSSKGTDVYVWVSGTIGLAGSAAKKSVFGGDVFVSGTLTGSVAFNPTTSSNWNPIPLTEAQALNQLAAPNFTASLVPPQSGQAVVSVSGSIAKSKSGVVSLNGTLTVNPSLLASGTAQLFRDSTAIGPTMSLLMNVQVPQAFSVNWIDTLPDVAIHTYSMQVSASVGTLSVLSGSGALTVREIN